MLPPPVATPTARPVHLGDTLSSLLGSFPLRAFVAPEATFRAPWAMRFPAGRLWLHVVAVGRVEVALASGQHPCELGAGDLVLAAHGNEHVLRSNGEVVPTPIQDLVGLDPITARERIVHGGRGEIARVVSVSFADADHVARRLFGSLPPLVVVRDQGDGWIEALLRLLALETSHTEPAAHELLHHLGHVLLSRALRLHLRAAPPTVGSLLERAGRRDVHAAVSALHLRPEAPWTVASLARVAGLSRSTFATSFLATMGVPPMRYLYERRMGRAAARLREGAAIKEIAGQCGYATEAAFTHAFRRWAGMPPGAFRTRPAAAPPPVTPADRG